MKYVKVKKFNKLDEWLANKALLLAESLSKVAIKSIQDAIRDKNIPASGELIKSWTYSIIRRSLYLFTVKISSDAGYWRAVDEGTINNPRFIPIKPLIKWIKAKGSMGLPVPEKESDIERLAWAIAITRSKEGIKGKQYLDLAIKKFDSRKNIILYNWTKKYLVAA